MPSLHARMHAGMWHACLHEKEHAISDCFANCNEGHAMPVNRSSPQEPSNKQPRLGKVEAVAADEEETKVAEETNRVTTTFVS